MTRALLSPSPSTRQRFRKQPLVGGQAEARALLDALRDGRCARLMGPRYHHKSQIMREACAQAHAQLGFTSLYVSMWSARVDSESAFFASLRDLIATKINRYYQRRLRRPGVVTSGELTHFLADLPERLHANVALFVDDLDMAPPHFLAEFLRVLRAAYQTTATGLRFLAVVCASHSLARTALGPTSPFENISRLVLVGDLTPTETRSLARQLLAGPGLTPTPRALDLIHAETDGDRFLVSEVCYECAGLVEGHRDKRLTCARVRAAMDNLVRDGGRGAILEGLQQIEADADVLQAILLLMREGDVPAARLRLDPSYNPDPLITSGLVRKLDGGYQIKSDLHHRLLVRHFSPEHVGRIFLAAGNWEQAIRYLGGDIQPGGTPEERARVMLAAVSAMYSVHDKQSAYAYLALGLKTAYPAVTVRVYDLDERGRALVQVLPSPAPQFSQTTQPKARPARRTKRASPLTRIPLDAASHPEIAALDKSREYHLHPVDRYQLRLFVPLRPAAEDNQGLVALDNFVAKQNVRRRQEQILELIGHLRHAARALKNRSEYESLYRAASQRAEDFGNLLRLTQELMSAPGTYQQVLDQALASALKALSPQAQMGSIYLYDRRTGKVRMRADTGYSAEVHDKALFAPGEGLAGYVYETGRPWIVSNAASDRYYKHGPSTSRYRVRSAIGVPLLGRHGPLGALCLDNLKETDAFGKESEQLLSLFAGQVALWLENSRLLAILRDLNSAILELRDLSSPDPQSLFETLAERLVENFDLNACALGLLDGPERVRFVVRRGVPGLSEVLPRSALPARLDAEVLGQGHALAHDLWGEGAARQTFLGRRDLSSLVALPLTGEQATCHGLVLLASVGEFSPSADELDLLRTFANQMTIALENADLYRKVHGELDLRIAELEAANDELKRARRREVQYRNARLATGLLHQINNAIANIPDLVDELQALGGPPASGAPLRELRLNALAAAQISRWLHQFIRIGDLTLEPLEMPALVEATRQRIEDRRPAHVQVRVEAPADPLPAVTADRALLEVLAENLLQNAYDAIPAGREGQVVVRLWREGEACLVSVDDNGTGVRPEDRERIWDWGYTTKRVDGKAHDRGLGLYACREIVEAHEGSLVLSATTPGAGATFQVRLPFAGPAPLKAA